MSLGYVLLDGHQLPVTSVRLAQGGVVITYELRGPLPPLAGNVTVYGADDRGIWQGHEHHYPAIPAGQRWVCTYKLTMSKVETYDEVSDWTAGPISWP